MTVCDAQRHLLPDVWKLAKMYGTPDELDLLLLISLATQSARVASNTGLPLATARKIVFQQRMVCAAKLGRIDYLDAQSHEMSDRQHLHKDSFGFMVVREACEHNQIAFLRALRQRRGFSKRHVHSEYLSGYSVDVFREFMMHWGFSDMDLRDNVVLADACINGNLALVADIGARLKYAKQDLLAWNGQALRYALQSNHAALLLQEFRLRWHVSSADILAHLTDALRYVKSADALVELRQHWNVTYRTALDAIHGDANRILCHAIEKSNVDMLRELRLHWGFTQHDITIVVHFTEHLLPVVVQDELALFPVL